MSRSDSLTPEQLEKCRFAFRTCACLNLRKVTRIVTQTFDEALQPTGLRSTQLPILVAAAMEPSTSIAGLARELVMDASTLQRNLRPLERDGLLEVVAAEHGSRKNVRLTKKGREKVLAAVPLWEQAQNRLIEQMGTRDWGNLLERLEQVLQVSQSEPSVSDA